MPNLLKKKTKLPAALLASVTALLIAALVFGLVFYGLEARKLSKLLQEKDSEISKLSLEKSRLQDELKAKDELIKTHKTLIAALRKGREDLERKYDNLIRAVDEAAKSVTVFKKKAEADKMLLAKYSKVFFLNEHYAPASLKSIPSEFSYASKNLSVKSEVYPFLLEMLKDMKKASLSPKIFSAYRSFDEQKSVKSRYSVIYGSASNKFSADQGYSEHQLGTTVDISNEKHGLKESFQESPEFAWLVENAWKYGFVLSYPKGNKYYIYEPWHWRFVGKALAKKLHESGKNFYDLPQSEINEYLIDIFER